VLFHDWTLSVLDETLPGRTFLIFASSRYVVGVIFSLSYIDNGGWINSLFPHIGSLRRPIANISGIDRGNQGSSIGIGLWTLFREKRAT
jgi:hypothetical protein